MQRVTLPQMYIRIQMLNIIQNYYGFAIWIDKDRQDRQGSARIVRIDNADRIAILETSVLRTGSLQCLPIQFQCFLFYIFEK